MPKNKVDLSAQRRTLGVFVGDIEDPEAQIIKLSEIDTVPQARKTFDEQSLQSLAENIKTHGVVQPVFVRPMGGRYQLVAGERRVRAALQAGLKEIPAVVRKLSDRQALHIMAIENFQREDLNPLEETEIVLDIIGSETGLDRLEVLVELKSTRELLRTDKKQNLQGPASLSPVQQQMVEVFRSLGRYSLEGFVVNRLGVLNLPEDLKALVAEKRLPYTRALRLARVTDASLRGELVSLHLNGGLEFVEVEKRIKAFLLEEKRGKGASSPVDQVQQQVQQVKKITTGKRFSRLSTEKQQEVARVLAEALQQVEQLLK